MIEIKIVSKTQDDMFQKREEVHNALAGSPAYINSEIVVADNDETSFLLIVGNNNNHDVHYTINEEDIKLAGGK